MFASPGEEEEEGASIRCISAVGGVRGIGSDRGGRSVDFFCVLMFVGRRGGTKVSLLSLSLPVLSLAAPGDKSSVDTFLHLPPRGLYPSDTCLEQRVYFSYRSTLR